MNDQRRSTDRIFGITPRGKPKYGKTARGFFLLEWGDFYGQPAQLQESSLAMKRAIWLGVPPNRLHLDRKQVKWLMRRLERWLVTGRPR